MIIPSASPMTIGMSSGMFHRRQLFMCLAWFSQPASCKSLSRPCSLELRLKRFEVLFHIGRKFLLGVYFIGDCLLTPVICLCTSRQIQCIIEASHQHLTILVYNFFCFSSTLNIYVLEGKPCTHPTASFKWQHHGHGYHQLTTIKAKIAYCIRAGSEDSCSNINI